MTDAFRWTSPLGISVAIFLAIGSLWFLVGSLTLVLLNRTTGPKILFVSNSTDAAYFGDSPEHLLASDTALFKLRTVLIRVIAGFLVLSGLLFLFVAWFALRERQPWALISLAASGLLAISFWAVALLPYFRMRIPVTLGDLPPFMWIPAALIVPATILGWLGLR